MTSWSIAKMRSSLTIAVLVAGALAVPHKRAISPDTYAKPADDVVYVTTYVTMMADSPPAASPVPKHHGHNHAHAYAAAQPSADAQPSTNSAGTESQPKNDSDGSGWSYSWSWSSESTPASSSAPVPVESTPEPVQEPAKSTAPAPATPSTYQEHVVYHHNIHRQNHSVPDVQWDDDLCASARVVAESCVYAHNTQANGGGYGQNIAAGVDGNNVSSVISDLFYNAEEPLFANMYGMHDPDMTEFERWGHFTQIVWKDTTHVACYTSHCPGGLANTGGNVSPYFTVCNYKGPGNYASEYAENVLRPKGNPTVTWSG